MTVTPITHARRHRRAADIPPGHWIAASLTAGRLIRATPQPHPDCAQCVARKATSQPTSQEASR